MVSNNQIVCTGRKIISQLLKSTVRFSFLTLHFLTSFIETNKDRCTACLYGMVSRIILLTDCVAAFISESDDKGRANFWNRQVI